MSSSFDRRQHRIGEPRYFEDLAVGERFYIPSRTMTEAHFPRSRRSPPTTTRSITTSSIAAERGHKGPLAHGFQILAFTAAGASTFAHQVGEALIAFVEQSSKFLKPVHPGDTLYPMLEIAALTPQRSTGVVTLGVTVHNQKGELVLTGKQKILLRKRPSS